MGKQIHILHTYIASFLITLPLILLLAVDCFGNSESIHKFLGIYSAQVVIPALLVLLLIRWFWGSFLLSYFRSVLVFIAIFGLLTVSIMAIYDGMTHVNATFALTRLNQANILLLTITAGLIVVFNQSNDWWRRYWKNVLFWLPFVFLYVLLIASFLPFDVFKEVVKEDRIVEYSQFFVLIAGGIGSLFIFYRLHMRREKMFAWLFLIFAFAFFFVAGDEISWGQRVLQIETNDTIKQLNRQEELTVHNLYSVEWLVAYGYFFLAIYGVFSRLVCIKVKQLQRFVVFTPSYLLIGYFLLPLIFYGMQLKVAGGIWHPWSEVSELYLYSGIVLSLLMIGSHVVSISSKITLKKLQQ